MNDRTEFTDRCVTHLPSGANDLVRLAAKRQFKRPSQYIRESVLHQLEADGLVLMPQGPKAA
jgi:hypothetical protein